MSARQQQQRRINVKAFRNGTGPPEEKNKQQEEKKKEEMPFPALIQDNEHAQNIITELNRRVEQRSQKDQDDLDRAKADFHARMAAFVTTMSQKDAKNAELEAAKKRAADCDAEKDVIRKDVAAKIEQKYKDEEKKADAKIAELEAKIKKTVADLAATKPLLEQAVNDKKFYDDAMAQMLGHNERVGANLKTSEAKNRELEAKIQELEPKLEEATKRVTQLQEQQKELQAQLEHQRAEVVQVSNNAAAAQILRDQEIERLRASANFTSEQRDSAIAAALQAKETECKASLDAATSAYAKQLAESKTECDMRILQLEVELAMLRGQRANSELDVKKIKALEEQLAAVHAKLEASMANSMAVSGQNATLSAAVVQYQKELQLLENKKLEVQTRLSSSGKAGSKLVQLGRGRRMSEGAISQTPLVDGLETKEVAMEDAMEERVDPVPVTDDDVMKDVEETKTETDTYSAENERRIEKVEKALEAAKQHSHELDSMLRKCHKQLDPYKRAVYEEIMKAIQPIFANYVAYTQGKKEFVNKRPYIESIAETHGRGIGRLVEQIYDITLDVYRMRTGNEPREERDYANL